jgi:hypothetical protein
LRYELTKRPTDKSQRTGTDLSSLERELGSLGTQQQFQLWMYRDDGELACVLANETLAYLSILPSNGEYVNSIDRDFTGSEDSVEEIYLENGQLDEMPRANCVARQTGILAGLHYFHTGTRAPFVAWIPDAGHPRT